MSRWDRPRWWLVRKLVGRRMVIFNAVIDEKGIHPRWTPLHGGMFKHCWIERTNPKEKP